MEGGHVTFVLRNPGRADLPGKVVGWDDPSVAAITRSADVLITPRHWVGTTRCRFGRGSAEGRSGDRPRVCHRRHAARAQGSLPGRAGGRRWEILLAQGSTSFLMWTGRAAPLDAMRELCNRECLRRRRAVAIAGAGAGWAVRWGSVRLARIEGLEPGRKRWQEYGPPVLSAVVFAAFALVITPFPLLLVRSVFALVLVQVIFFDFEHRLILDRVMFPSMGLALLGQPVAPRRARAWPVAPTVVVGDPDGVDRGARCS